MATVCSTPVAAGHGGKSMAVKLKDIAARAGVSATTCSLILNNKPISVSEETKQKVLETAQQMGYTRKLESRNFGLIVPDLGNLFYTEIIKNISHRAQEFGYNLIILDSNNDVEQEYRNILQLKNTQIDGIILSLVRKENVSEKMIQCIRQLNSSNIPVVLFNSANPVFGCHSVILDDYWGGYLATRHLIDLGHRRIGCIIGYDLEAMFTLPTRLTGYQAAVTEAGIPFDRDLITGNDYTIECGYQSAAVLAEKGVTAIFAHNDMIALGAYHYLREHHIRIPEDISLVGFDNIPIISTLELPLTTVAQPITQISNRCIDLLLQSINTPSTDRVSVTLQPELVIRKSTGPVTTGADS